MIEHSPRPATDAGATQPTAIIRHRRLSLYANSAPISEERRVQLWSQIGHSHRNSPSPPASKSPSSGFARP